MLKGLITTFLIAVTIWATSVGNSLLNEIDVLRGRVEETEQDLGGINFVSGKVYKLSGSGISSTAETISLTSFQKPITDQELAMTDFGDIGYATIDPGTTEKKEFISFTGVTQDGSSDKASLTGVTRGLQFTTPYTASSTLAVSHSGGAKFIISNAPQLYNEMAIKRNDEDILGQWTFDADDIADYDASPTFTTDNQIITKKYADDLTYAGAPDGSLTVKGLFEMATLAELISGTATGTTGAYLTAPTSMFATTTSASNLITVTDTDGLLSQTFLDLTESFTFSGAVIATSTLELNAGTSIAEFSTDTTLAGNSDDAVPTEKAVKTYVDSFAKEYVSAGAMTDNDANASLSTFNQSPIISFTDNAIGISSGSVKVPYGKTGIESIKVIYFNTEPEDGLFLKFHTGRIRAGTAKVEDETDTYATSTTPINDDYAEAITLPAGSYDGLGTLAENDLVSIQVHRDGQASDSYIAVWRVFGILVEFN